MRILVVGRSGQVATALVERARGSEHEVIAIGRPEADLDDPATLVAALETVAPDAVVNAAAYTAVDAAETDEAAAFQQNAVAPGVLARECAARHLPFLHLSTDYVFDGLAERPYREDDPIAPQSVYGRSKAAGEAAVRDAGGQAIIARTAWVYAPFGKNFLRTMLRVGAERDTLRVVADQHGNPTSALDIADAILALLGQHNTWPMGPDTVHLVAEGETSWFGFASEIFAAARLPNPPAVEAISTAEYPTPAKRPANSRLDTTHLRERYGIELPDWQTSTRATVARLRDAPPS